jgi:hypothetical protein
MQGGADGTFQIASVMDAANFAGVDKNARRMREDGKWER